MKDKLTVLHLFPEFRRGGSPVNTLRFIKASRDELIHIAAGKAVDRELFEEYAPYAEAWDIDLTKPSFASILTLWKEIRRVRPDIIHANGKAGSFYGWILSFLLPGRIRMFLTLRGFHDKFTGMKSAFYRFIERSMARRTERVISVSPSERKHYLELIKPDPGKVIVVPNGIDVHQQDMDEPMAKTVASFRVNIVSLSRITPQKDLITMIRSFEKATEGMDHIALHIMGGLSHDEEEYRQSVEDLHAASPAGKRIFFWGDVKQAGNLIACFDLYFSTARFEGLPTAVVESFLSGVPVVGTACIGNIDLIREGETGWLAEIGDVEGIGEALKKAIASVGSEEYRAMAQRAALEAQEYSVENQARRLLALYRGEEI